MASWGPLRAAFALAGLSLALSLAISCSSYPPSRAPRPAVARLPAPSASETPAAEREAGVEARRPQRDVKALPASLPPFLATRETSPGVASLQAELVRRRGGEWVMVSLTPRERSTADREGAPAAAPLAAGQHPRLGEALRQYERAFEHRDAERLGLVWIMNPYERTQMRRLFAQSTAIAVSIEGTDLVVRGDRASLGFDQRIAISRAPRLARALGGASQRALLAHDAHGTWALDQILERD